MENKFNFFVEAIDIDIAKASKNTEGRYDNMILEGIASDATKDADGEILEPDGFQLDRFLSEGLINYEHMAKEGGAKYIIGEPLEAKVVGGKFKIKAKLYKGSKIAEDLWEKLIIMQENGSKRRLGWSIEGKTLSKDGNRITKALVTHCAVTFMPKNYNTFANIVKGEQVSDFIRTEIDRDRAHGGFLFRVEKDGKIITIHNDLSIEIKDKAMDLAAIAPLMKESLDKKVKNTTQANLFE
jgi:hypothetical protein